MLKSILVFCFLLLLPKAFAESVRMAPQPNPDSEYARLPERVYVDPDFNVARVTTRPGVSWQDCEAEKIVNPQSTSCIGWPDSQSELRRVQGVAPVEVQEIDTETGDIKTQTYIEVQFKYKRSFRRADGSTGVLDQVGRGWISADVLRAQKMTPVYEEPAPRPPSLAPRRAEPCDQEQRPLPGQNNRNDLSDLARFAQTSAPEQLESAVEAIRPLVGQCPLDPPNRKKSPEEWKKETNIYDLEALPKIRVSSRNLPLVPKLMPDGTMTSANSDDLIDIDTLARTIYSEMNECFQKGIQYPMAAARVALNRKDNIKNQPYFTNPPNEKTKPDLSRVLVSPFAFSVWNRTGAMDPRDKTILMSLCPTRDESRQNWKGAVPSREDRRAWDMALKIATEAVLFPSRFRQKTNEVTQKYYTSKREKNGNRVRPRPPPNILGRPVESFQCMYVWNGD